MEIKKFVVLRNVFEAVKNHSMTTSKNFLRLMSSLIADNEANIAILMRQKGWQDFLASFYSGSYLFLDDDLRPIEEQRK